MVFDRFCPFRAKLVKNRQKQALLLNFLGAKFGEAEFLRSPRGFRVAKFRGLLSAGSYTMNQKTL